MISKREKWTDLSRYSVYEVSALLLLYVVIVWVLFPSIFISKSAVYFMLFLDFSAIIYYLYISPVYIHRDTLKKRGLGAKEHFYIRTDNLKDFYKGITLLFIASALAIILFSWYQHSPFFQHPNFTALLVKFIAYIFSATLQDLFFFSFLLLRLKEIITVNSGKFHQFLTAIILAILFMMYHYPNTPLMILSFCFAFIAGYRFYNYPNLFAVVTAHAILGTLLHRVNELHMKIGPLYELENNSSIIRFLIPPINAYLDHLWKN